PECHSVVTRTAMAFNAYVCPQCDEHLRMKARDRLNWFFDQVECEIGQQFTPKDPLGFVDSQSYPQRLAKAQQQTGESEALIVMQGVLGAIPMVACAFEFDFMGGSMGSVVGDRFVLAAETAISLQQPLICFAASGGARMQEGMISLMQMARTAAAAERLKQARLPYIVVLTHPVYGGVTASLAMLGDIHLAEPKAMVGFAGKRVIEQTVREVLQEPFQRAEFLLEHGAIDQIVHRHALRDTIQRLIAKLMNLP
ncbi:MAG: acetyl-CoA carboxylase carboxyltransferase subunit beta, partial [Moraxellaceae bacterium]